jgi:GT2 family glycosyltransferase
LSAADLSRTSNNHQPAGNNDIVSDRPPLVSIVLPTYNGSRYLREAIESCLAQTYQNWELIVVDDCSTDATPDIIVEFTRRDPRIRSIRHEVNKKLPAALNTGHAAAAGEYLTWTSDDNRFLPAAIEDMTGFLEQHPSTALVYTDCILIDAAGQYLHDFPAQPPSRLAYMDVLGACFLYRRAVYETLGGYDAELFLAEDYEYWLRAYRQFELAPLHKVLYEYRWHNESLTKSANRRTIRTNAERALRRHLPHLRSLPQDLARGWTVCAANAMRRGDVIQAVTAYARALRTAPGTSLGYVGRKLMERLQRRHAGAEMMPNGEWSQRSTSPIQ